MNNKQISVFLIICITIGCVIFFLPSDEQKIRDNLASLAVYCSSAQEESVMETLKKAALAAKLCTDPCKVQIESFKIDHEFTQKEITDHILMMKKRLPGTIFSFQDTAVDIPADGKSTVTTTLILISKTVDGQFTDAYELTIVAEKNDGDWYFSSFTVVEFMKK